MKLRYSIDEIPSMLEDPLVLAVINTTGFQRLRGISFLGAIDRRRRGMRHNRFDHSIGVALLAQHYAKQMGFAPDVRKLIVLSGLLHDIGHAPLSHSLEPVFAKKFGLDHHIATRQMLTGAVRQGKEVSELLRHHKVDPEMILHLIAGRDRSPVGRIFSSPINIDTIEAIWRGGSYIGKTFSDPIAVLDAFIKLDKASIPLLDSFWDNKDIFYQLVIYSAFGVMPDSLARESLELESKLRPEHFFMTERSFLKKFPAIRQPKFSLAEVQVKARKFQVNHANKPSSHDDLPQRFVVIKHNKMVMLRNPPETRPQTVRKHNDLKEPYLQAALFR